LPLFEYINLPPRKINVNENGALIHSDSLKQLGDNSGWDKRREWAWRKLDFEVCLPLIWKWAKRLAERMSISEALALRRNSGRCRANAGRSGQGRFHLLVDDALDRAASFGACAHDRKAL
jgi:hypothetical protein